MQRMFSLAAVALATMAAPAAAATLVSVEVNGPTGTIWDTEVDGNYAVFLQRPTGNLLNPTDNFGGSTVTAGSNNYLIQGDGYPGGTSANSDPFYTLVLRFSDGATISGGYSFAVPGGEFTGGTSTTVGGTTYTLTGFGWDRSRADNVSQFAAVSGDDPNDYTGQFAFSAVSGVVPEPATWALFILGFGAVGAAMRTRTASGTTVKTQMRFS